MWPLLPSYGVLGSLMWLPFGCAVDAEKERAVWTNSTTERDGEAQREREDEMRQKVKENAPETEEG